MRKKLLFCSALLLSASLAGCGYNDDNVHETIPALPDTCSSTNDCVAGGTAGQCVEGHCLRVCEDRSDCEGGTICESGLCRHIENCPETDKSKNSKCLKVFKHTPTLNWIALLQQDVQLKTVSERNASTNFTSQNFTLQIPHRSLMGGLNYSLVMASALTYIILENMASTFLMQCMMPDTLNLGKESSPLDYQIAINEQLEVELTDLLKQCETVHDNHVWVDDFPPNFNKDLCTSSSSSYTYMDRFSETKRKAISDKLASYLLTGKDLYNSLQTEIDKKQQELNSDKTKINNALTKLNKIEIADPTSTFAKIENEANLSATDLDTLNNTLEKLQANLENNQTVLAGDLSKWSATAVKNAQDYILQLTEIIHMVQTSQATATSRKENMEDLQFKMSADRCDQASLAWKTLQSVYSVITEATLGKDNLNKTSTYYVINWAVQFLQSGDVKTSPFLYNKTIPEVTTRTQELSLPTMNSCKDLVENMQELQTTICYDILYGVLDNPLMNVLKRSKLDFVKCLTDTNVGPALIKNGWEFIDGLTKGTLPHTLPNIATVLMMAMSLSDSDIKAKFSNMSNMVTSLGDPTFIWLTEGNVQELNIISDQTDKNPFKNNDLILSMEYKPQSTSLMNTAIVTLNTYGSLSVTYNKDTGIPDLIKSDAKSTWSPQYTAQDTGGVLSMYSTQKPEKDANGKDVEKRNVYEFFVKPTITNSKKLTCGGVVLDIDTIDGYVVLEDSDIKNMNGTALVRDASN